MISILTIDKSFTLWRRRYGDRLQNCRVICQREKYTHNPHLLLKVLVEYTEKNGGGGGGTCFFVLHIYHDTINTTS